MIVKYKEARLMFPEQYEEIARVILLDRGYKIVGKLGEGYCRDVYHVRNHFGFDFVAKTKKKPAEEETIQHRINLSGGDLDDREVKILTAIDHPGIIRMYDFFEDDIFRDSSGRFCWVHLLIKDYKEEIPLDSSSPVCRIPIFIEEYFNALSLEELVAIRGPILNNSWFKGIFSQVSEALRYLHSDKKIFHRDIKPQNILIERSRDRVKLTDFQNAVSFNCIQPKALPTRGGTPYTHPCMINSLLGGEKSCATTYSEFYGLGATMFYALTGVLPFDYRLCYAEDGQEITVKDSVFKVALFDGEERISRIDAELHNYKLKERLNLVPRRYRSLLGNCLSLTPEKYAPADADIVHSLFREDFERATKRNTTKAVDMSPLKEISLKRFECETFEERYNMESLKDSSKPEVVLLSNLIPRLIKHTIQYGQRKILRPTSYSGNTERYTLHNYVERFSLKQDGLELIVEDVDRIRFCGLSNNFEEETFSRRLIIAALSGYTLLTAEEYALKRTEQSLSPKKASMVEGDYILSGNRKILQIGCLQEIDTFQKLTEDKSRPVFTIEDLLSKGKCYDGWLSPSFSDAQNHAGLKGIIASLPFLIAGKSHAGYDNYLWKNHYEAHSELIVGIDRKVIFVSRDKPVLIILHGDNFLYPEYMQRSLQEHGFLKDGYTVKLISRDVDNLLNKGILPTGRSVKMHNIEEVRRGLDNVFGKYAIALDLDSVKKLESGIYEKKQFLDNELTLALAGTTEFLEAYFDKSTHGGQYPFWLNHHLREINPWTPQSRFLTIPRRGFSDYNIHFIGDFDTATGSDAPDYGCFIVLQPETGDVENRSSKIKPESGLVER